jgi:ABC-2 type transport system permease protein
MSGIQSIGRTILKYVRLLREFFRACLVEEFEYRANFVGNFLNTMLTLLGAILTIRLFFLQTDSIGGWSFYEVLALLGVFNAMQGLIAFFLQPNMSRLVNHIREGTLDFVLLKPVDSQFYISFRHLVFWRLADVVIGIALTAFATSRLELDMSYSAWLVFTLFFVAAVIIVYSLWMGIMTCSFWAVKVDNLSFLFQSVFETARYPVSVYKGAVRFVLTYIFPVALVTTVPAQSLTGRLTLETGTIALLFAILLAILSRLFWKTALKSYTSASS